ncbi:MAG: response regulator [Candidatus Liptonbacteria bacterium]|nr:response regulator [Candidatus Liptonbacteria bacterium]
MADAKKRVAVIEDDRFLSTLIKTRLEREGLEVVQCFDGEQAVAWLRNNKPDALILDLIMPKMSGFDVLEAMSMDPQMNTIPVIVLSNLAQESDVEKAKRYGAKEYFVKVRISIDAVASRVKALLDGK